eukprot:GHVS01010428.1.p1 GENE.GHVS01010428.1~~GHVS01010428.1.p1  ORF type:complete len:116 (+),score=22.99 GHVS01010428.1:407-754(+)
MADFSIKQNASNLWISVRDSIEELTSDAASAAEDAADKLEPWQLALVVAGLSILAIAVVWWLVSCVCRGVCSCCEKLCCGVMGCCCRSCWYVTSCKCCRGKKDRGQNRTAGYMGI